MAIPFKRGDDFVLNIEVTENDVPVPITGWTVRSQIRKGSSLLANLIYTAVDETTGKYKLKCSKSLTKLWDIGTYDCDIEYTNTLGETVSSETFQIQVIADITRD